MTTQEMLLTTKVHAWQVTLRSALLTAATLFGGMLIGFLLGFAINELPMHMPDVPKNLLSFLIVLVALMIAGAAWGRGMARLYKVPETRRLTWAGGLSFGPGVLLAGVMLSLLEVAIVERRGGPALPIHVVFTLLFVPAAFLVASLGGMALGIGLNDSRLAGKLALGSGVAASLAFLAVDLIMDALGWRVGAPGAAARATMLTVMMTGNLAAALAGGAAIGYLVARFGIHPTGDKDTPIFAEATRVTHPSANE